MVRYGVCDDRGGVAGDELSIGAIDRREDRVGCGVGDCFVDATHLAEVRGPAGPRFF